MYAEISTQVNYYAGFTVVFPKRNIKRVITFNRKGDATMEWEYCQLAVNTKGWVDLKLPEEYLEKLNQFAIEGWEVDQMLPIHSGISGTTTVIFLLRRERKRVQS